MRFRAPILFAICLICCSSFGFAQARALINSTAEPVTLLSTPNRATVLGSVVLGKPQVFTTFNIQAAGTITPDPALNGAAFQLHFLICDQPDCTGDIVTDTRILPDAESATPSQVIATRSFGVKTHNVDPVVLSGLQRQNPTRVLYLAVALELLPTSTSTTRFTGRLNLLRVDVLP